MQLRWGKISAVDLSKNLYKVTFDEDKLVSGWIQGIVPNTKDNQDELQFTKGEHVVCAMTSHLERGVILGSVYDTKNAPPVAAENTRATTYKDGTFVKYDSAAKKLTVSCEGDIEVVKVTNIKITSSGTITLNNGTFGGLIKIDAIVSEINSRISGLKTAILTGFSALSGIDSGASSSAFNTAAGAVQNLAKASFEDTKIKH